MTEHDKLAEAREALAEWVRDYWLDAGEERLDIADTMMKRGHMSSILAALDGHAAALAAARAQGAAEAFEKAAKHIIENRPCKIAHSFQPSQCETCYWHDCTAGPIRALAREAAK